MVAMVCCLVAERPLQEIWQSFCFWTMPYSLLVLPLLALIGVSYRIHVRQAEQAIS